MSWAANRRTKRIEDRAYSLFGIFQVHLPMLYGEREAAFQRLQREILKTSEDDTLFAWIGVIESYGGLLAPNIEAFREGDLLTLNKNGPYIKVDGSGDAERLIRITTTLYPWCAETYLVFLGCGKGRYGRIGIFLRVLNDDNTFFRVHLDGLHWMEFPPDGYRTLVEQGKSRPTAPYRQSLNSWARHRSILIRQLALVDRHIPHLGKRIYGFQVVSHIHNVSVWSGRFDSRAASAPDIIPSIYWNNYFSKTWVPNGTMLEGGIIGFVHFPDVKNAAKRDLNIRDIHFGFDHAFNPVLYIRKISDGTQTVSLDPFLARARKQTPSSNSRKIDIMEEDDLWDSPLDTSVIGQPDRDFWVIRADRKRPHQTWHLEETRLSLTLTRIPTSDGLTWQLDLGSSVGTESSNDTRIGIFRASTSPRPLL